MPITKEDLKRKADPPPERLSEWLLTGEVARARNKALQWAAGTLAAVWFWVWATGAALNSPLLLFVGIAALGLVREARNWWALAHVERGADWKSPQREAEESQETIAALSEAGKRTGIMTVGIAGCIGLVGLAQLYCGIERSVELAGLVKPAVRAGDWWRTITASYLHGGYYHVSGNVGALLTFGRILESKTPHPRLPLVYFVSVLAGSFASILLMPEATSVGASGGLMGVLTYLYVLGRRHPELVPPPVTRGLWSAIAATAAIGAFGFAFIDNAAHAGGALAGAVVGGLTVPDHREDLRHSPFVLLDLLGWIAAAAIVAGAVFTTMVLLTPA